MLAGVVISSLYWDSDTICPDAVFAADRGATCRISTWRSARSGRCPAVSPRRTTRNTTALPVTTYIHHIHGRVLSVPEKTPCASDRTNAGTASRCMRLHQVVPIRFRIHEVTSTTTVAYIEITPNAVAAGRYEAAPGMRISAAPNGMNGSTSSPP